jgi:peptidase E
MRVNSEPRRILISGGGFGPAFIAEMARLTGKERPRICYLPTAVGDDPARIAAWYETCADLDVEPRHQVAFISTYRMERGWDEVLLAMDGIVASGGNTLNQQAIWRAQGIDEVLRTAWRAGIVLGGSSAGSLCWFEAGTTDSRPRELGTVECLGFLPGSHCPHYDGEQDRRPLYRGLVASGELPPGWACDDHAGIVFEGAEAARFVAARKGAGVYRVEMVDGRLVEKAYPTEQISPVTPPAPPRS